MNARSALPLLTAAALLFGACASGGAPPEAESPAPSPTPIPVGVSTPEAAAALVIATDPRFAGAIRLTPDIIGASRWWESEPLGGPGFRIRLTIGWGDCPAGCISRHTWTYDVSTNGQVSLVGETGDPIPPGGVPAG